MSTQDPDPHDDAPPAAADPGDASAPLDPARRRFLAAVACTAGGATLAAAAAPVLVVLADPVGRTTVASADDFVPVGPAERFTAEPVRVELRARRRDAWTNAGTVAIGRAWVRRLEDGAFAVFSSVCPHLGCEIGLGDDATTFDCPCHESLFRLDGEVEGGPSPRGLDPLEHRVGEDGALEIRFQRFELNTKTRTPREA